MSDKPAPQRRISSDALEKSTGKGWDDWFAIVDEWGGAQRSHAQIAEYLASTQGVDGWWAQGITVGYEQERGMRVPGQMADGTFTANASKTIKVSDEIVFDFFADEDRRSSWLPDQVLSLRTARRPKSLRFDFGEDASKVIVELVHKNDHKVAVQIAHERLKNAEEMEFRKAFWKEKLAVLAETVSVYRPM